MRMILCHGSMSPIESADQLDLISRHTTLLATTQLPLVLELECDRDLPR